MRNIKIGAFLGVTGIVLGAFGAHGLEKIATPELVNSFKTGVNYQMIHAFYFLIIGILYKIDILTKKQANLISIIAVVGIILFSGSIYGLTFAKIKELPNLLKIFGPITPIGGLSLIISWFMLLFYAFKKKS